MEVVSQAEEIDSVHHFHLAKDFHSDVIVQERDVLQNTLGSGIVQYDTVSLDNGNVIAVEEDVVEPQVIARPQVALASYGLPILSKRTVYDIGVPTGHGNVVLQKETACHAASAAIREAGSAIIAEEDGSFHFEVVSRSAIVMDGFVVLQKQAIRDGHMRGMVDHAVLQTFTDQMIYHHRPAIVQKPDARD